MSEALSRTEGLTAPASDAVSKGAEKAEETGTPIPKGAWAVMFTVLGASMMDLLDATVMNVAAPSVSKGLGATHAQYQWINIGYVLSFSVLLIAGGRLGDIVGRRRMFLIGLAGFTVMSGCARWRRTPAS